MSLLFTDLIKAMKQPASKQPSEARLNELMAQLFSSATDKDEEDTAQAPKSAKKGYTMDKGGLSYFEQNGRDGAREALDKAAEIEIELDGEEDEGDESESEEGDGMEKGAEMGDKEKRRELMSAAYSMIDNLSDEELSNFLAAREVKKAQIMGVLSQMSTSELAELVSVEEAQGARAVDSEKL
jgi:hypothetical protein